MNRFCQDVKTGPYGVKNVLRLAHSEINVGLSPLVRKSLIFSVLLISMQDLILDHCVPIDLKPMTS